MAGVGAGGVTQLHQLVADLLRVAVADQQMALLRAQGQGRQQFPGSEAVGQQHPLCPQHATVGELHLVPGDAAHPGCLAPDQRSVAEQPVGSGRGVENRVAGDLQRTGQAFAQHRFQLASRVLSSSSPLMPWSARACCLVRARSLSWWSAANHKVPQFR